MASKLISLKSIPDPEFELSIFDIINFNLKKKNIMKSLLSFVVIALFSVSAYAQSDNDYLEIARDVLKTEKKAVVAEVMQLTDTESQPFWDLYNEYQGKLYLIQNKRIAII